MNDFLPPKRPLSRPSGQPTVPRSPATPTLPSQNETPPRTRQSPTPPLEIKKPRRPTKKTLLWVAASLTLVIVASVAISVFWYNSALSPRTADAVDKTRLQIETGSSPSQIGQLLEQKGLIRSSLAFDIYTRLSGTRNKLQAGTYTLSSSESTQQIVSHIVSGKTDQFSITFLPGATLAENRTRLIQSGYSEADVDAALKKPYTGVLFVGKPTSANLEGYIYGETYSFSTDATVEQILQRTFDEFSAKISQNNLVEGFKKQGLDLYQGITLASIIQREVSNTEDQKQVAQIFYSRLALNMPLGSDVTAYYGADLIGASRAVTVDTPYNTRIHTGLPPGPIATPGLDALIAAVNPADGDYLYFLSGDDDVTYYGRTDAEHEANIRDHCAVKCAIP